MERNKYELQREVLARKYETILKDFEDTNDDRRIAWNCYQQIIAACEAITDWLLSEEGQSYIVKGWMHSVLKDFPTEPYDGADTKTLMETNIPVDWERCYKNREEIRTMFQEKVTIE